MLKPNLIHAGGGEGQEAPFSNELVQSLYSGGALPESVSNLSRPGKLSEQVLLTRVKNEKGRLNLQHDGRKEDNEVGRHPMLPRM